MAKAMAATKNRAHGFSFASQVKFSVQNKIMHLIKIQLKKDNAKPNTMFTQATRDVLKHNELAAYNYYNWPKLKNT